jgi:hypothetical protein
MNILCSRWHFGTTDLEEESPCPYHLCYVDPHSSEVSILSNWKKGSEYDSDTKRMPTLVINGSVKNFYICGWNKMRIQLTSELLEPPRAAQERPRIQIYPPFSR